MKLINAIRAVLVKVFLPFLYTHFLFCEVCFVAVFIGVVHLAGIALCATANP